MQKSCFSADDYIFQQNDEPRCIYIMQSGMPKLSFVRQEEYVAVERLLENIRLLLWAKGTRRFFIVDDLFRQGCAETIQFCHMLHDYQKSVGRCFNLKV